MPRNRLSFVACLGAIASIFLLVAGSLLASLAKAAVPNITVVKIGSGAGSIVANVGLISCGSICADSLAEGTSVTLTATPDSDSQFVGWLGPCTGRGICSFSVAEAETVTAGFAPISFGVPRCDIDGDHTFQPMTDGTLLIRYLFGLTGQELITGATGAAAARTTVEQVTDYLNNIRPMLDIDGDGRVDGLTDGLLIGRYLFGLRGPSLIAGAVAPNATRSSSESIETQLVALTGLTQTINFLSSPPSNATVNGQNYTVLANATSGLPVTLSIDSTAASICSIAASTVSFNGAGTCVINANQFGNDTYGPAPRVQQSFAVGSATNGNSYSTVFANAENPLSEGGRWTNGKSVGIDWNDVQSVTGKAYGSAIVTGYNDDIAVLNTTFAANQYAEGTVFRAPGYSPGVSHEIELLLHFQITANSARGYEVLWSHEGYMAIVRWNGPLGNYTPLVDGLYIGPAVDGDVLRAEIVNNVIRVYKNGGLVATGPADSTWTGGQPGIGFWPKPGATLQSYGWKSFAAGSL